MADVGVLFKAAMASVIGGRFHPGEAPEGTNGAAPVTPYGVYSFFEDVNTTLQGASDQQPCTFQVDVYATSYMAAEAAAKAVAAAMALQSVEASPPTFSASPLTRAYMGVDRDVKLHRVMLEFFVWYIP